MKPNTEDDEKDPEQNNFIKEFTINEIQDAIDRLKKGKAKDSHGIRAEPLKNCSDETKAQAILLKAKKPTEFCFAFVAIGIC